MSLSWLYCDSQLFFNLYYELFIIQQIWYLLSKDVLFQTDMINKVAESSCAVRQI